MKIQLLFAIIFLSTRLKAQHIEDAKQLIETERYQSAEILLERELEKTNADPEINYLLVKSYLEQDKISEAEKYVTTYLPSAKNENADPINQLAYARYLLNSGQKQAAENIFSGLLADKKNKKNPELLLRMAEVVIEEKDGDAASALTWLDLAEKKDKQNTEADIMRGLAYRKLGDATNAYIAYQHAIKNDPKNVRAYYLLGKIFTAQNNPDIYMEHFLKAYSIDSTYAPVLEELYNHYYTRDIRKAKIYLEKYVQNTDYSIRNDYYMTDMMYLTGDYPHAIANAKMIITKEQAKAQPRLYKLIAYSYAKSGDSITALQYIRDYLSKEKPDRQIGADFELTAQLLQKMKGQEEDAIRYYSIAFDMDTISAKKAKYAQSIADLYKQKEDYIHQAQWLGKLYQWKEKTNNVDLFNWGLAYYMGKDYKMTDSVFSVYTERYPENIYGYYWRALANASIDTAMTAGIAIPFYQKVAELGETDKVANKKMLLKAYGYLGGYEANVTRNYEASLSWFEKYAEMEENAEVKQYIDTLQQWIAEKK